MVQAFNQQNPQYYQTQPEIKDVRHSALAAHKSGLSVVPIANDGTKRPLMAWSALTKQAASPFEVNGWFTRWPDAGLAVIGGKVSGNLEILDFDKAEEWGRFCRAAKEAKLYGLVCRIAQGYMERSPKGVHLLYRCETPVEGNLKLARALKVDGQGIDVLIETRGEGGYVIVAPSMGKVHPTGKPYVMLVGSFDRILTITTQEREVLLGLARSLDRMPQEEKPKKDRKVVPPSETVHGTGGRPGDDFNARASWDEILRPSGWKFLRRRNQTEYWQRPGKGRGEGWSATVNHRGCDLFYVFSSATGFDAPKAYTKFAAYAILNHGGDFSAAAKSLAGRGYGTPRETGDGGEYPDSEDDTAGQPDSQERTARGRRRKTRHVEMADDQPEKEEEPAVELDQARLILAEAAAARYFSTNQAKGHTAFINPKLGKHEVLQVASQPGTGKGYAFNEEATRQAERNPKNTTAWFSPRLAMYTDQHRHDSLWKLIEGRKAARDAEGAPVDFDSPAAAPGTGNCTVDGEAYHHAMAEKGWERESHKYCQMNCPAAENCQEFGYLSKFKKDGRNAVLSLQHLFTTAAKDFKFLTVDEISYHSFVDVKTITGEDFAQARQYIWNTPMQYIMRAIAELMVKPPADTTRLSGAEFYQALDKMSREVNGNRGLMDLLDQAGATGSTFSGELWELMAERTAEAASKLPPNIWAVEGSEPGSGGVYDILKEEARNSLEGLPMPFVSRLELVKTGDKPAVLMLYRRRYLSSKAAVKPISVLDATGDCALQRLLLTSYHNLQDDKDLRRKKPIWRMVRPQVRTVAPRVEMPGCVKVIQDTGHNFSKTSLLMSIEKDPDRRYWNTYIRSILKYLKPDGARTLLVCSSLVEEKLAQELAAQGVTESAGYHYAIEHYGNLRGTNAYKNYDRVIEAGMYMPDPEQVVAAGRALYGGDGEELDTEVVRLPRLYNYQGHKEGKAYGAEDDVLVFRDDRLQKLLEVDREDEHLQVAHRIRPLQATTDKEIVLLFAIPVRGLAVDRVISDGQEFNARTKKAMDKGITHAKEVLARETNKYFTAYQMHEATGLALGTIYKHWNVMLAEAGAESLSLECIQTVKGGRNGTQEIRRSLAIAAPIGTSRIIIKSLIILGEVANLMPKGWRLASMEEAPLEAPVLEQPLIEDETEVRPDLQGQVAVRLHLLAQLEEEYQARLEADGRYSQAAALIRERYILQLDYLNALVKKHAPRGPRTQQEVA